MNKKQLLIAAMAAVLSVSGANAASDITGVTGSPVSGGNIFNIDPEKVSADIGYRQYENFILEHGDIANLLFHDKISGRNLETFINLVNNGVKIDGILNTMRGSDFYNGHAVFITPGGMTIGASGVLNVGTLSVITPESNRYNALKSEYESGNYSNINNISTLLNRETNTGNITVDGKIFARNGVQLRGGDIAVGAEGAILNGVAQQQALTTDKQASTLFNSLVNTSGMVTSGNQFVANGSNIQIKSTAGTDIAGKVINGAAKAGQANSGLYITNSGSNGTKISGLVQSTNDLNVYNKAGDLSISGTVKNTGDNLEISNAGTNLTVGGKLSTDHDLAITNNGTGALTLSGTTTSTGKTNIVNEGAGGMNITGSVTSAATPDQARNEGFAIRIINRGGKMVISNTADKVAADSIRLENQGSNGMELAGVKGEKLVSIENKAGDLTINGKLTAGADEGGNINILNGKTANKLALASAGEVVGNGNVSVKNEGAGGMELYGNIKNNSMDSAETAINNNAGAMIVDGDITTTGNTAIKNQGSGMTVTKNSKITNDGQLKFKNYGQDGMTIVGNVDNTGNMTIYNDNGMLTFANDSGNTVGGTVANHDGNLAIWSRENSKGISTQTLSSITNDGAGYNIAMRHDGNTSAGDRGIDLQGKISSEGQLAINNYSGDMYVSGELTSDGNMGVINRAGGGSMELASAGKISSDTANINIKNYGSGDMTVNSEITHSGRVNVLANSGKLNMGATVHNNGSGSLDENNGFYAAARENGTGINVTSGFKADGTGQNLIKNISGDEGLRYEGNMNTSNAQTELYNQKGDMTVGGQINTTTGNAVILNKGDGMTVNGTITSDKDVKVVNKGSEAADVSEATIQAPNQTTKWFWQALKDKLGL